VHCIDAAYCYTCRTFRGLSVCPRGTPMSHYKRLYRLRSRGMGQAITLAPPGEFTSERPCEAATLLVSNYFDQLFQYQITRVVWRVMWLVRRHYAGQSHACVRYGDGGQCEYSERRCVCSCTDDVASCATTQRHSTRSHCRLVNALCSPPSLPSPTY